MIFQQAQALWWWHKRPVWLQISIKRSPRIRRISESDSIQCSVGKFRRGADECEHWRERRAARIGIALAEGLDLHLCKNAIASAL
jgi:hypothetical protein